MTWAPPYATASDLQSWLGGGDTAELALAVEAASRAIDRATGRQFGSVTATRFYVPDRGVVDIADTFDAGLIVEFNGEPVEFTPLPRNAPADGQPWTQLRVAVSGEISVIGEFGWPTVPDAIKLATLIQAARFYSRRQNVGGPLSAERVDDVAYTYGATTELDTDVAASIADYVRPWYVA